MKYLIVSLLLALFLQNYSQVPDIVWQDCYDYYTTTSPIIESDNGILQAVVVEEGTIGGLDIRVRKYDSNWNVLWEKDYGGSGGEGPERIINTIDGGFLILGVTTSTDGDINSTLNGDSDAWVFKIDNEGNLLWSTTFGGTTQFERFRDIIETPDGGFVILSRFSGAGGDISTYYGGGGDYWLCKSDSTGVIEWEKTLGGPGMENCYTLTLTSENHIIASGLGAMHGNIVECYPEGWGDAWIVELDLAGDIISQHCYGGSYYDGAHKTIEIDDGYIIAAVTSSDDGDVSGLHGNAGAEEPKDIWLVKLNKQFEIEWQKCLGGTETDAVLFITENEDKTITLIGYTRSHDGDVASENHSEMWEDLWVVKVDSEGEILWEHCYGGEERDFLNFHQVVKKSDYNYIVAATSNHLSGDVECGNTNFGDDNIWLIELKDCDYYQAAIPSRPTGADTLCSQDSISFFTAEAVEYADHYAWLLQPTAAGSISGDSLQAKVTWSEDFEGTATITVKAVNDCGQSEWSEPKEIQIENCTGISANFNTSLLHVYPNPAKNHVTFEISSPSTVTKTIQITNLFGQEVTNFTITNNQTKWNIKNIPKGMYFYQLLIKDKSFKGKIIIQ